MKIVRGMVLWRRSGEYEWSDVGKELKVEKLMGGSTDKREVS